MKEYERLTNGYFECSACENGKCIHPANFCIDRTYCEIYNRLYELEDKIDNGTIIEMPLIVHPNKNEWFVYYQYPSGIIQYDIKYSKQEAEAKLKELKGDLK